MYAPWRKPYCFGPPCKVKVKVMSRSITRTNFDHCKRLAAMHHQLATAIRFCQPAPRIEIGASTRLAIAPNCRVRSKTSPSLPSFQRTAETAPCPSPQPCKLNISIPPGSCGGTTLLGPRASRAGREENCGQAVSRLGVSRAVCLQSRLLVGNVSGNGWVSRLRG